MKTKYKLKGSRIQKNLKDIFWDIGKKITISFGFEGPSRCIKLTATKLETWYGKIGH